MSEPTKEEWAELREYLKRVDRMLIEHEAARWNRQYTQPSTWIAMVVSLSAGALIFLAGMFVGARL